MTAELAELVTAEFDSEVPEVWIEIAIHNFAALRQAAFLKSHTDKDIAVLSVELVYELVAEFGGQAHYIPSGRIMVMNEKYDQIVAEFDGKNLNHLARKHRVSAMRIRQILQEDADRKKLARAQGKAQP